jgi:hypothetical protein
MWGALSDERTGLPFTISAAPRQRSHSWVWLPRNSWPYFTVSDSRLPQSGVPGPLFYILQEQGGPVIPAGTGFPFRRLLRLAGLRWGYSNPPPRGVQLSTIKVIVTLRLTVSQSVSQSVSLGVVGLMPIYLLLFHIHGLVFVGRPLWLEDGSVFCQSHCLQ